MRARNHLISVLFVALGSGGALAAAAMGLPLPFLMGSLLVTAILATKLGHRLPDDYEFPNQIRLFFIGLIGLMIGTRVSPELFSDLRLLFVGFLAVTVFVVCAYGLSYQILRHVGKYDRPTAFFAGAPGGLIESVAMAETAKADLRLVTLMQFLRIVSTIAIVPLVLTFWVGSPVGDRSGLSLGDTNADFSALPFAICAVAAGLFLGSFLRLPARMLTGPLIVSAGLGLTGWVHLDLPGWTVAVAQIVVGTTLGMRFAGMNRALLLRGIALSAATVLAMLAVGSVLAFVLVSAVGQPFDVLLISLAPGG